MIDYQIRHRTAGLVSRGCRDGVIASGMAAVLLVAGCTGPSGHHGQSPAPSSTRTAGEGLTVPLTYQQACADESSAVCAAPGPGSPGPGQIPAQLRARPLQLRELKSGQACPALPGHPVSTAGFGGTALGNGPVRVLIAGAGDLSHGSIDLLVSDTPGWRGTKTLWFSSPAYQGPWIVRGVRLDGQAQIRVNSGSEGPFAYPAGPLVVPPGGTPNETADGYREAPSGTFVTAPGCYGWQVDGQTFTEIIVARFVCVRQYGCPRDFGSQAAEKKLS